MDLLKPGLKARYTGFPRPRGDGPDDVLPRHEGEQVSPPTRGWTSGCPTGSEQSAGFPAHAGMDPYLLPPVLRGEGFPRPRGDGPEKAPTGLWGKMVSPPTRGWTHRRCRQGGARCGFPAHAGMDPAHTSTDSTRPGFPRPRGDGPHTNFAKARAMMVSPPTRGWTDGVRRVVRRLAGFPAHAGMDPVPLGG